jgi:Fe-S cluster assembly iron-binding protein IscA
MLNVSDKAAAALRATLEGNTEDDQQVLRIERDGASALALRVDARRDGDQVVSHDGREVLVVEPAISDALDGATLDAVESPDGLRLVLSGTGD